MDPEGRGEQPGAAVAAHATIDPSHQPGRLKLEQPEPLREEAVPMKAQFVTPHDPVILNSNGTRAPAVTLDEAEELNRLSKHLQQNVDASGRAATVEGQSNLVTADQKDEVNAVRDSLERHGQQPSRNLIETKLEYAVPQLHTSPLFPALPLYGPPSVLRRLQSSFYQISSFFLSLTFLMAIVSASLITSLPRFMNKIVYRVTFRNYRKKRPFYDEEVRRAGIRKEQERAWQKRVASASDFAEDEEDTAQRFKPTEGGKDPILCDVAYYARRVGLDVDKLKVTTEDGFVIDLWHVYDPQEYIAVKDSESERREGARPVRRASVKLKDPQKKKKYPVLLMHGLLQSSGAYCCNDDDSLAFWLCKAGYDVWLGNNRCGFEPKHETLENSDPRMWSWNIRQMGVFDLSALVSQVLLETNFEKLGLICHSQGTTQTFVALAKEQRPELGEKLSVFCALAPAAYAGPLIGKIYFKFMRLLSPGVFRVVFGIHAFIPFMMQMHAILHPVMYGWLGYKVFSFLFDWSDARWDRGLRDRQFQFAPVYVSAESMRWWLGREGFARHKCILATKETLRGEDRFDRANMDQPEEDGHSVEQDADRARTQEQTELRQLYGKGSTAWYNERAPPMALWICGNDDLVDGGRLLRRLENGREPHVQLVHSKTIPGYEHLDVLWAMDAKEEVFKEVAEIIWKTCLVRDICVVPYGCENVAPWSKEG